MADFIYIYLQVIIYYIYMDDGGECPPPQNEIFSPCQIRLFFLIFGWLFFNWIFFVNFYPHFFFSIGFSLNFYPHFFFQLEFLCTFIPPLFANTPISDRVNLYISELQKSQIPPALEQNRCYSVFSKITNLLIFHPLYRPFFGLFTHFSKIPNFWNCISLHFGFFGPNLHRNITSKKRIISGVIFF